jgi:hypothetical protein
MTFSVSSPNRRARATDEAAASAANATQVLFTSFSRDRADPDGALAKRVEDGVTRERTCSGPEATARRAASAAVSATSAPRAARSRDAAELRFQTIVLMPARKALVAIPWPTAPMPRTATGSCVDSIAPLLDVWAATGSLQRSATAHAAYCDRICPRSTGGLDSPPDSRPTLGGATAGSPPTVTRTWPRDFAG